jgi:pteridine reductase
MRGYPAYLAAKAGLWSLTEALALELAPRVRVNGVAPGHMIWATNNTMSEAQKSAELARVPLARLGGGEEVAKAVRFLLSADAAYITGAVLPVDGGLRLT